MNPLSREAAARRKALESWANEQAGRESGGLATRLVRRAIRGGTRRGSDAVRRASAVPDRIANRLLDRGLDTTTDLELPLHKVQDRLLYVPSPWHVLPRALRYLGVSENDTFVEFGCGKGRVVHQAAKWPFRRVIGVEISPELAQMARAVVAARAHQHRCRDVEIVVCDAREFRVPDDVTVAYFFMPFGEETLAIVLRAIIESIDRNPRLVRLVYLWPMTSPPTILGTGRFRVLKKQSSILRRRGDRVEIYESC